MSDVTKKCPYCAEEILFAAIKCKHCGSNLTGQAAPSGVVTIQRTSKSVKKAQAIGWIAFWIGICLIFGILDGSNPEARTFGGIMVLLSIPWLIATRAARWWKND